MRYYWLITQQELIVEIIVHSFYLIFYIIKILFIQTLWWRLEWIRLDRVSVEHVKLIFDESIGSDLDLVIVDKQVESAFPLRPGRIIREDYISC